MQVDCTTVCTSHYVVLSPFLVIVFSNLLAHFVNLSVFHGASVASNRSFFILPMNGHKYEFLPGSAMAPHPKYICHMAQVCLSAQGKGDFFRKLPKWLGAIAALIRD
jgi:hypothetical protein